jgi:putative ABC transport system permease protein
MGDAATTVRSALTTAPPLVGSGADNGTLTERDVPEGGHAAVAFDARPGPDPSAAEAPAPRGTAGRLLRFAMANVRRRPDRSLLAVGGIGLAVTAVVLVRTISAGYQETGGEAVSAATGGAPYWVVPEGGVDLDPGVGLVVPRGEVPDVAAPPGWSADTVLVGDLAGHDDVALVGRDGPSGDASGGSTVAAGTAVATPAALERLGLGGEDSLRVAGETLTLVAGDGPGASVTVARGVAAAAGVTDGWVTLAPPPGGPAPVGDVEASTGLDVVTDPAHRPPPGSGGLVYATAASSSRAGLVSFDQKMAALLGGKVTSSALGLVSQVGLALGFVIAVSTFVAAVQERRREFGIMASIGLTDEVLYFFLVESLLLFTVAYVAGVGLAGLLVAVVTPSFFTVSAWLSAAALVATYLPALGVVAALIPVHRLLQQRPVALLADEP